MLITSATFFFDVVNNKRQLNKNKTLLYCYTSSRPNFSCQKQASQTFRDMKLPQREEITRLQSHQANGRTKVVPCIALLEPQNTLGRKRYISTVSCFSTEAPPQGFLRGIVISRNALWCLKAPDTTIALCKMSSPHLVRDRHWSRGFAVLEDGRGVGWKVPVSSKGTESVTP